MLRACVGHRRAAKSPVLTVSDRLCLKACKESTSILQKCSKKNKVNYLHQGHLVVNKSAQSVVQQISPISLIDA